MSKNVSDVEYLKILDEAYEEAWEVANSEDGWKEEHKGSFLSYGQHTLRSLLNKSARLTCLLLLESCSLKYF